MKNTVLLLTLVSTFLAPSAHPMAQWDRANRPELMDNNYERKFSKLPLSGKLKTLPWSDDYWPTYKGGITYRWNNKYRGEESQRWTYKIIEDTNKINISIDELSPAEKYDLYLGNLDFPLTKYERERTKIMKTVPGSPGYDKDFKIPEWEGICHAWAPATLHYKNSEPITVIGKKGHKISFGSSDLHALLSYHLHLNKAPKTTFLGSRCNLDFKEWDKKFEKKEITKEELDKKKNSAECSDTNAGAFHVALVNQIGLKDEGFVADVTRDSEVWNQPIYSFETRVVAVSNRASAGAAPGTVREITVHTKMGFVQEIEQTWAVVNKPFYVKIENYDYRLELNKEGEIIGGEWISHDRPDFIWKNTPAPFIGYFKDLERLYKMSVAYLNPSKFSYDLKEKIKKTGRVSLIKREFIKDARMAALRTALRDGTIDQIVKQIAVKGFKKAGEKQKAERIATNMAKFREEAKTNILASKFVDGLKDEVRNSHIEAAIVSSKKQIKTNYLAGKFIKETKAEVRNSHIKTALESSSKKLQNRYLVNKFIKGMIADKAVTKVKNAVRPVAMAQIFTREVGKDAKETRRVKEDHKDSARDAIKILGAKNFLSKKFIAEVSKDAKESRLVKEANKEKAIKALNKFSNHNFYGKKFISEVQKEVIETNKIKEAQRLAKQKELDQALLAAVKAKDLEAFKKLIKEGAAPTISDEEGLTPLMIAVSIQNKEMISELLKKMDIKAINAVDKQGRNALIWAIVAPGERPDRITRDIVRDLLDKEIEVNQKDNTGKTALAYVTSGEYKSKLISWALKNKGGQI